MSTTKKAGSSKAKSEGRPASKRLKEFEQKILIRALRLEDFDQLVEMQRTCFPGMATWTREQIASQLKHFPEGQLCIEYKGKVVASTSTLIVDFDEYSNWHNWREISDNGYIRNHDYEGETMYGIEIMVHPEYRGLKLARRLYEARKELARRFHCANMIVGGRIPGYHKYADEMSAREYVERVITGGLYDPVLTTQIANGFVLKRLIPNYFPSDDASRGYATFLEWTNLDYVPSEKPKKQPLSLVRICAVQYQMRQIAGIEDFKAQVEYFIDTASDYRTDFLLFPELITTQLLSFLPSKRPSDAARKLAELTPQYLEFFTTMAVKYNINIIGGSQFSVENEELRNISYLFRRDGTIEKQYKVHITPSERRWWGVKPGDRVQVFDTDRGKIAILVCYDVEFPELCRIAASQGAQIFFVPFNTEARDGYLRVRHCAQARCVENHVYVALSGCVGNLPFVDNADIHYAQSGIYTPMDVSFARDGIAAECTPNIETLVIHDVDLEVLRRHKASGTVQNWNDRRRDIYRVAYTDPSGGPDLEA